jgi:hypothetical protein
MSLTDLKKLESTLFSQRSYSTPFHNVNHQSGLISDPVILFTQSFTALRQPLTSITGNRQLRSTESELSALRAKISFMRASNKKLSIKNSILRNPKIITKRKRNLNQDTVSQAQVYKNTTEQFETEAAKIRHKAAKLRAKEWNEPSDRAVNSTQLSTS